MGWGNVSRENRCATRLAGKRWPGHVSLSGQCEYSGYPEGGRNSGRALCRGERTLLLTGPFPFLAWGQAAGTGQGCEQRDLITFKIQSPQVQDPESGSQETVSRVQKGSQEGRVGQW